MVKKKSKWNVTSIFILHPTGLLSSIKRDNSWLRETSDNIKSNVVFIILSLFIPVQV